MSFVTLPDPHPGRCINQRPGPNGTVLRCLDYEGTSHVCTFPSPAPVAHSVNVYVSGDSKPRPWVKPGEVRGGN